jgi:hypothetical protein
MTMGLAQARVRVQIMWVQKLCFVDLFLGGSLTRSHFSAQTILSLAASMTNHIPARKRGHEGQEGRRQTKILPPSHQARLFPLRRCCQAFSGPSLYSASDPDFGSWHCFQIQSMLSLLAHLWPMNLQKLAQPCQL